MLFNLQYSKCKIDQATIVSKEFGNYHILYNRSGNPVFQFHIDGEIGCAVSGERCDYIVEVEKQPQSYAYVIELKGSDLNKAIGQIQSTVNIFREKLKGYRILPRIVIHKVPTHDVHGKKYRDFKKVFPEAIVKERKCDIDCV